MLTDTKNMSYANFNITFGKNNTPMLEYFIDVIFPAMTSEYKRSDRDGKTHYFFNVRKHLSSFISSFSVARKPVFFNSSTAFIVSLYVLTTSFFIDSFFIYTTLSWFFCIYK